MDPRKLQTYALTERAGATWLVRALEGFQFIQRAGPVGAEEAGEATIGENFAVRLAAGAVVGFVVGVADSLNFLAAPGAGLSVTAVRCHPLSECGDLFGEVGCCICAQTVNPEGEGFASGVEEALPLIAGEFVS